MELGQRVDRAADLEMAERITVNAKCQRMGVCNAAESLVVHADVANEFLPLVAKSLTTQPGIACSPTPSRVSSPMNAVGWMAEIGIRPSC